MFNVFQDLRFAFRTFVKNPGFAAITILTLALGIGATTAIFSVVYGVLLRPLPYDHPNQIVRVWETTPSGQRMNFADPNFEDLRDQNHSLQGIAEYTSNLESISGGQQPTRTMVTAASRDFFNVLRVQPMLGRMFAPEEQRFGAPLVALVRYGYWKQYLGGNTDLSSLKLTLESRPVSVIGILPAGFDFPDGSEVWVPREIYERYPSRTAHNWRAIARLRNTVTVAQASADLKAIGARIRQQFGNDVDLAGAAVLPLQTAMTSNVSSVLYILLGAVAFLLLIACANVANLLLAQGAARQRELAIRAALGAERGRLVRQFLTEALLLSAISGVLGILAATWGVNALLALKSNPLPNAQAVGVNAVVLLFAVAICFAVALLLGVLCAVRATRGDLQGTLAEGARHAGTTHSNRLGALIVTGQLAGALILLVGAGLLGRSLLGVLSTDPGFHTDHVLTVNLALGGIDTGDAFAPSEAGKARRLAFLSQLFRRLHELPGVDQAGGTGGLPLADSLADGTYVVMNPRDPVPGKTGKPSPEVETEWQALFRNRERTGNALYCVASEDYFAALGIPLVEGRLFEDRDTPSAPHVALISKSLAQEKWPKQDPLGQLIEFGNMDGDPTFLTVVGVVGDVRSASLEQPPVPTIYTNYRQRPQSTRDFTITIRTAGDPAQLVRPVLQIIHDLDPTIPPKVATFSQVFSASLESRRFSLTVMSIFSATALMLALAGIYGVISYSVTRRTREFGVRIAMGASTRNVVALVLGEGMRPVVVGILIGIAGGLALMRTIQSLLFNVSANDPLTYAAVAALLVLVAALACFVPAWRATRVDPLVALHYE